MLDAMWKRKSIRVFENESLKSEDIEMVKDILNEVKEMQGPFGHQVEFFLVNGQSFHDERLGSYGVIKHPQMIIGGYAKHCFKNFLDFGFLMEDVVLKITKLDIGSVWEEGHFNSEVLGVEEKENLMIPAIVPIGYPKGKVLKKRQFHINPKKEQRLDIRELAFVGKKKKPMNESDKYHEHIRAVQIAPSGSNKQPWRFHIMGDDIHVYLKPTKGYGLRLPKHVQALDMGIALRHLTYSLEEKEEHYELRRLEDAPSLEEATYICTVKIK